MQTLVTSAATALRATGGRMTAQRRLILETLERLSGHPTAEEVCAAAQARDPRLNPSTVYRTLAWLEDAGLVNHRHLDAGSNRERCERFDPATPVEHHHFICGGCGRVIEFEWPELAAITWRFGQELDAKVERASLTLYGLCAGCRGSKPRTGSR